MNPIVFSIKLSDVCSMWHNILFTKPSHSSFVFVLGRKTGAKAAENSVKKPLPRAHSLVRPNPKAARDAYHQQHGILDHEQREDHGAAVTLVQNSRHIVGRQVELDGVGLEPVVHPLVIRGLFVKVAADDYDGGHHVHDAEDADAHHELFQLVGLVSLVLHDIADPEQRDEAREQKAGAQHQVEEQGRDQKAPHQVHVPEAREADAAEDVGVDLLQPQNRYQLDARYGPGGQVKIGGYVLDGLVAPLEPGGQEPGERQDHPPDGRGHAEKVDHHEEESAWQVLDALHQILPGLHHGVLVRLAHNGVGVGAGADQERHGHHHVAGAQKYDGPFWVAETRCLDQKGQQGDQSGAEAKRRPNQCPRSGEADLALVKQVVVAWHPTTGHVLIIHRQIVRVLGVGDQLERRRTHKLDSLLLMRLALALGGRSSYGRRVQLVVVLLGQAADRVAVGGADQRVEQHLLLLGCQVGQKAGVEFAGGGGRGQRECALVRLGASLGIVVVCDAGLGAVE
ncbi:hypothetical protein BpHYR1_002400 [Brachionus plicatilis]|uniref:Uncharacterized protein n=1 Tax=Brachionus plicatilis TaxID=10195 RepID=A0A3M7RAA9_BRAPC|nr:hypothetical protein BpHYR1_002400 [Brachionus plicatilis]